MNVFDIILLVIVIFLFIRGCFRGLVREVASILGLVLAFYLANTYHPQLIPIMERFVVVEYAKALSYLVLFFGVLLGVFFISLLLRGILKLIMLGWLDILGGGVLGALKGTLIACILVLALTAFLPAKAPILTQSKFVPYITRLNNELAGMLPDDMKMQFEEKSRSLDEYWRNTWKHPRKNAENQ